MKKFISKNWKKILITIGVVCIIINLGVKILQDTNVVTGYIENGPVIEKDIFDNITDTTEDAVDKVEDNPNDIEDEYGKETGIDSKSFKTMIVAGAIVLGVVILGSLLDGDDKKPAKKK